MTTRYCPFTEGQELTITERVQVDDDAWFEQGEPVVVTEAYGNGLVGVKSMTNPGWTYMVEYRHVTASTPEYDDA